MPIWPRDWESLFVPGTPLLEVVLRGTLVYLALFALLRFFLKREAGTIGVADLLVIVLLADAAQNALAGGYRSITEGIILVVTILFWSYALNWLGYRYPRLQRLVHPPPLLLIKNGRLIRRNLERELITEEELMSHLRMQGIDDAAQVAEAYMEGDGQISVVRKDRAESEHARQRRGL